ncbi:type II toxin-antitoxin system RelE/ParE family toxin [Microcella sp.]|uniref:type II toxin-antitoxin system RelE/ParE family toxin n=1 Tax=Microcella sp. TaxID=1913979 RepID=UPI00255D8C66|nr:type II toxin-antitoxin system RelE/ParE family toxin [Microcella sp.]MBX9471758.1 type II toxin-antitoxin system RelE/ParE family toxin [Microcella sp.]
MTRRAQLHPEAVTEFLEAVRFYEQQQTGLGEKFEAEVAQAVDDVIWSPDAWPELTGHRRSTVVRSRRVSGFPYRIVYFVHDDNVVIVAVAHERRHPGYWNRRVDG